MIDDVYGLTAEQDELLSRVQANFNYQQDRRTADYHRSLSRPAAMTAPQPTQIPDLEDQIPSVAVVSVGTIIWTAIALGAMFGFCVASALVMASHI